MNLAFAPWLMKASAKTRLLVNVALSFRNVVTAEPRPLLAIVPPFSLTIAPLLLMAEPLSSLVSVALAPVLSMPIVAVEVLLMIAPLPLVNEPLLVSVAVPSLLSRVLAPALVNVPSFVMEPLVVLVPLKPLFSSAPPWLENWPVVWLSMAPELFRVALPWL